jgi:mitogen-activated protein kinase 1/3
LESIKESQYTSFYTKILDIVVPKEADAKSLDTIFLVMERDKMDLTKFFNRGVDTHFSEKHLKSVLYNLLCAMNFLATANVIHRDIKPANILMNKYCQVKVCDFGLARTMPEKKGQTRCVSSHVGSRWYRAPEIIALDRHYDQTSDVWSVGCIAYELIKFRQHCSKKPKGTQVDKLALFPGTCCRPLSPNSKSNPQE